ncbi:hypothetical protein B0T10DRAFT_277348 [Thelonectria olida]|uniref:Uncharacterized protein n=1 Tax=Thelonectria olida TaxID=1576542 RepID=A0A9P8WD86_9HYPO|nr:hypothetical protein B0T10DRAFT_277348 [Thelonectria olida]
MYHIPMTKSRRKQKCVTVRASALKTLTPLLSLLPSPAVLLLPPLPLHLSYTQCPRRYRQAHSLCGQAQPTCFHSDHRTAPVSLCVLAFLPSWTVFHLLFAGRDVLSVQVDETQSSISSCLAETKDNDITYHAIKHHPYSTYRPQGQQILAEGCCSTSASWLFLCADRSRYSPLVP